MIIFTYKCATKCNNRHPGQQCLHFNHKRIQSTNGKYNFLHNVNGTYLSGLFVLDRALHVKTLVIQIIEGYNAACGCFFLCYSSPLWSLLMLYYAQRRPAVDAKMRVKHQFHGIFKCVLLKDQRGTLHCFGCQWRKFPILFQFSQEPYVSSMK